MGTEVLTRHSTQSDGSQRVKPARFVCKYVSVFVTPVMALVGEVGVPAVACYLAEVKCTV